MQLLAIFNPVNIFNDLKGLSMWGRWFAPIASILLVYLSIQWGNPWWGIVSAVAGVLCVVLVADRRLTNFFWGIINCALYGLISYNNNLWGEMTLNWVIYLPFQFIGLYYWSKATYDDDTVVAKNLTWIQRGGVVVVALGAIYVGERILIAKGGAHPILDSAIVVLSILATVLMAKRYSEQWICWIAVNVCAITLWTLRLQAGSDDGIAMLLMWIAFLVNSVYGAWSWYKEAKRAAYL